MSLPTELEEISAKFYTQGDFDREFDPEGAGTTEDSLVQIHQALVHWAVNQWRVYFAYLVETVDRYVSIIFPR